MNIRILKTFIKNDCKSFISNKNVIFMLLVPVLFCVLYNYVFENAEAMTPMYTLQLCAIFCVSMIPTTVLPTMIAEEKEKNTLRSLILANVKGQEFLFAKLIVCMLLTLADAVAVFFVAGATVKNLSVYLFSVAISTGGLLFLGAVAGLLSKDQTSAGTIGSPLMMVAMIPPLFADMNKTIEKIAKVMPTTSFQTIFTTCMKGESLFVRNNVIAMLVCVIWMIVGFILFNIFYKRRGVDY
ncbi:MAG: ABC transporter permease [Lachnospiraceae bacterium]|nr:ABC transporter permease [Lachnospiraceae bacterium]